jgi:FkbM family methyltransferase
MKYLINSILGKFGYRLTRIPVNEGLDVFEIQKSLLKNSKSDLIILDVGAYKGDVTLVYSILFPDSKIFSFEPFYESFTVLQERTASLRNIYTINKALGNSIGKSIFYSNKSAPTNSILPPHSESSKFWNESYPNTIETVEIELDTIDNFVSRNGIDKIDILKIDAQGSEYLVLNGAINTMQQNKISLIYLEIILVPTYEGQKYLDDYFYFLRSFGFMLYNFYNPSYSNNGTLRQFDCIFIKS